MQKAKVGDLIYATAFGGPAYFIVRETHDDGTFTAHNIAHGTGYRFRETPYQIVFSPRFYGALKELWPDPFDKKITQESEKAAKKPERVPEENSKAQIPPAHVLIGHQTILGHKIYVGLGDGYVYAGFVPFGETATIAGGKLVVRDDPRDTEKAAVGDLIKNFEGQYMTVEYIDSTCAYGILVGGSREYASPHGTYTIVKRASDNQRVELSANGKHIGYVDSVEVKREADVCRWDGIDTGEPITVSDELRVGFFVWDTEHECPAVIVRLDDKRITLALMPQPHWKENWFQERYQKDGIWENVTKTTWMKRYKADAMKWLEQKETEDPVWSIDDARTFRAIIKDYEESAVAAYKRDVSTAELVAMLAKRKGVVEFQGAENPFLATPCTILVIPEDAK
jgi:hypothetical protein